MDNLFCLSNKKAYKNRVIYSFVSWDENNSQNLKIVCAQFFEISKKICDIITSRKKAFVFRNSIRQSSQSDLYDSQYRFNFI